MAGQGSWPPEPVGRDQPTRYDATYAHAGQECSSTNEGRVVNIEESLIVHPAHADGLVDKGDPVVVGWSLVGIALRSATAATDTIPVDTEGIWYLNVAAVNGNIGIGDMLFIDWVTAVVSNDFMVNPFGHALGFVAVDTTALIAVKVHAFQILPWWFWWFF